jgi:DNA-binding transcriptional LysR family regulator
MTILSSDHVELVATIARLGHLPAAARELRCDHSTVFRQLKAIEKKLGTRLFDRIAGRYVPTAAGNEVAAFAAQWVAEIELLTRKIAAADKQNGLLRVTTTEDVAMSLLPDLISNLVTAFPDLRVECNAGNRLLDLSRLEADVAIRPTRKPPEGLVGNDLGVFATAVYGRRAAVRSRKRDVTDEPWLMRTDASGPAADLAWMTANVAPSRMVATFSSFSSLYAAAIAGVGLALLPCFIADREPLLERRSPPIKSLNAHLWLLYHARLRRDRRVLLLATTAKAELGNAPLAAKIT